MSPSDPTNDEGVVMTEKKPKKKPEHDDVIPMLDPCLLYTSDAADE